MEINILEFHLENKTVIQFQSVEYKRVEEKVGDIYNYPLYYSQLSRLSHITIVSSEIVDIKRYTRPVIKDDICLDMVPRVVEKEEEEKQ